ncbi:MAG: hypothetical protein JWN15_2562 [Firmicutes bacterium]|nr:hypothetical protein [Bacillota bacterium]
MFLEWVAGVLFRPGATFERARKELRFGYWWIVLSVMMLEAVMQVYSPVRAGQADATPADLIFVTAAYLLLRFDIQGLLLMGVARAFQWQLSWSESLKYIGLGWAVLMAEDIATFYPALKGYDNIILWASIPFFAWYLISLTAGLKRITAWPLWKVLLIATLATVPWRAAEFWLTWQAIHPA